MVTYDSSWPETSADLFHHATAEKAAIYRAIMEVFAAAKRQYLTSAVSSELQGEGLIRPSLYLSLGCIPRVRYNAQRTHITDLRMPVKSAAPQSNITGDP